MPDESISCMGAMSCSPDVQGTQQAPDKRPDQVTRHLTKLQSSLHSADCHHRCPAILQCAALALYGSPVAIHISQSVPSVCKCTPIHAEQKARKDAKDCNTCMCWPRTGSSKEELRQALARLALRHCTDRYPGLMTIFKQLHTPSGASASGGCCVW